jgi:hypothetical protein
MIVSLKGDPTLEFTESNLSRKGAENAKKSLREKQRLGLARFVGVTSITPPCEPARSRFQKRFLAITVKSAHKIDPATL